jgi:hypothetical protein
MHQRSHTVLLVLSVAVTGLAAAFACGCGGSSPDSSPSASATGAATPGTATLAAPSTPKAPTLALGESIAFTFPDGGVVKLTADEFGDPAAAQQGVQASTGERLVALRLTVAATPAEGASGQTATAPFSASSFLLVAADDSLYVPPAAAELYDGPWETISETRFALPFVVPDTAELVRFVCTPTGDVTPRSATWLLE